MLRAITCEIATGVLVGLLAASRAEAQAAAPPAQEQAPPPAPPARKGLEFAVGDWAIKFYGFIRVDAHYDDSHPNNTQLIVFIKPEEDLPLPGAAFEEKDSEDFTIHARNTRFGVDVAGPPVAALGDARALGKIEFDFLANGGSEAIAISRGVIRMRQAYVNLSWERFSVLAGQTWDVAAPLIPTANGDFVMWGAGNLGDRRPMVMADFRPEAGPGTLILQAEAGLSGADDCDNIDGGTTRDGEASGLPSFQGRLAFKGPCFWLEKKSFEIGGWGYYAEEHLDTIPAAWPGEDEDDFRSTAFGIDVTLPLLDFLEVRGEAWQGRNVNDIRGGIGQGIAFVDGDAEEIESRGFWVEVLAKLLDGYTLVLGTSHDNPVNKDVSTTLSASPVSGVEDNSTFYVCNRVSPGGGLLFGLDYTRWITLWRGGDYEGTDNRVSFFVQYNF